MPGVGHPPWMADASAGGEPAVSDPPSFEWSGRPLVGGSAVDRPSVHCWAPLELPVLQQRQRVLYAVLPWSNAA